jgi:hypothetical protein
MFQKSAEPIRPFHPGISSKTSGRPTNAVSACAACTMICMLGGLREP